jgi:hypothetical protein
MEIPNKEQQPPAAPAPAQQIRQPANLQIMLDDINVMGQGLVLAGAQSNDDIIIAQIGDMSVTLSRKQLLRAIRLYE